MEVNFTAAGLQDVLLRGLSPAAVWQAVRAERRVIRAVGRYALVLGVADSGQRLAVLVEPADDGGWDVVAARELDGPEAAAFDDVTRRT